MKIKLLYTTIAILASFMLFSQFVRTDPGLTPSDTVMATRRSFSIEVNTIGTLDAARSNMVTSALKSGKGKIIHLIKDGSWVEKGDMLVQLDPLPFEEEILLLKGEIKKLEAAVSAKKQLFEWEKSQVEKELNTAEFNVHKADLELTKYQKGEGPLQLAQFREEADKVLKEKTKYLNYLNDLKTLKEKGYDQPSEIARSEKEVLLLDEKLKAAEEKFQNYKKHVYPSMIEEYQANVGHAEMLRDQTRKGSVYKIAQAKSSLDEVLAGLENYKNRLEQAENQLRETTISAPSSGIVILYEAFRDGQNRKPRIGDTVLQNQPILYLPDISAMVVKTNIREVDLHKVRTGQSCSITVDAYPDKSLEGSVSFIGALASGKGGGSSGAKYFQMSVVITSNDSDLRPGMTARVNILTEQVKNTLTLPLYAVFE
ncbi:MAG: efflux RND transporter periplasmic adaptor subunit, partial [Desulfobacteraceae bacterium]|nr:efflux RND transporter periplasmic adaptor subunit [Desulfobacteraceae bacterium]